MIKITTNKLLLLFLIYTLLGCYQQEKVVKNAIKPKCISSQSDCMINTASGNFSVLFSQDPIMTENPFDIVLTLDGKSTIKKISAHMEGKDMFMGKIPLFFETYTLLANKELSPIDKTQIAYLANTLLGSCSEQEMRWIIYFEITLETQEPNTKIERFTIEYNSVRFN